MLILNSIIRTNIRNTRKNIITILINNVCFALGIVAATMLLYYVVLQYKYDTDYTGNDVAIIREITEKGYRIGTSYRKMGKVIEQCPKINESTILRSYYVYAQVYKKPELINLIITNKDFFNILKYPLIHGSIKTVFKEKYSIIISKRIADKYFPENPIGRYIEIDIGNERKQYVISGVIHNELALTSFKIDYLINFDSLDEAISDRIYTVEYLVRMNADNAKESIEYDLEKNYNSITKNKYRIKLVTVNQMNFENDPFDTNLIKSPVKKSNIDNAYILICVIILCILTSTIMQSLNRINSRNKEYSIRSIYSGTILSVYKQILIDVFTNVIIAIPISVLIIGLFKYDIEEIVLGIKYTDNSTLFSLVTIIWSVVAVLLSVVALAISLYAKHSNPNVIDKKRRISGGRGYYNYLLYSVQGIVFLVIITISMIIRDQYEFIIQYDLGLELENVVVLPVRKDIVNANLYYNDVIRMADKYPGINSVTFANGNNINGFGRTRYKVANDKFMIVTNIYADNFTETMSVPILNGKFKRADLKQNDILVNREFIKQFEVKHPENKKISEIFDVTIPVPGNRKNFKWSKIWGDARIVGITENFYTSSLMHNIEPVIIWKRDARYYRYLYIKLNGENSSINGFIDEYAKTYPDQPVDYRYLSDMYISEYDNVYKLSQIINYYSIITCVIAFFGLFLIINSIWDNYQNQISVRKLYGASELSVIRMIVVRILPFAIIAGLLSIAISFYFSNLWLQTYIKRIDNIMDLNIYAILILLVLTIVSVVLCSITKAKRKVLCTSS